MVTQQHRLTGSEIQWGQRIEWMGIVIAAGAIAVVVGTSDTSNKLGW